MMHFLRAAAAIFVSLQAVSCLPEPEAGLNVNHLPLLSREKRAGACKTTADCISGNVCSKWGWCQWTTIYGKDGPSQGASAPGEGKAGQCVTSADCASRVPYCSKLGFCHGGRLPFDPEQLEIPDEDKTADFPQQPQGLVNNDPRQNNPLVAGAGAKRPTSEKLRIQDTLEPTQGGRAQPAGQKGAPAAAGRAQGSASGSQKQPAGANKAAGACPGDSLDICIAACVPIQQVKAYGACVQQCGQRCPSSK